MLIQILNDSFGNLPNTNDVYKSYLIRKIKKNRIRDGYTQPAKVYICKLEAQKKP